ncbi:hypothetical protein B9Z55_003254 [Caenorhabditis nigoni]|uniref:Domain of unknown function WSN domain-containing protein n=1 Tax=Caenorhabditis nigoni TaxID=1611254 RepID=A0A2G5VP94_9PELO|nr:hypothetical protein B9Z55_003254 [Caenorhabditis nigoni]
MISRICLILLICVVWPCSTATNNTVLFPVIEKSASLARISAAITIHNGIYSKNSIVQEVTAEFLDISPPEAKDLLEHDYGSLSDNMNKFYGSLSKIPAKLKNGDELIDTINLLLDMKVSQEYLKPGAIGDQTDHFAKTTKIMEDSAVLSKNILHVLDLGEAAELLRKVRESDGQDMKAKAIEDILSKLRRILTRTDSQLGLMNNYKTVFQDYLSLESLTNDLQPVINAAGTARKYTETINKLDPFRKDLMAASENTDQIKTATNEILKYSETIQHLFPTSSFLNSTNLKYDSKVMTRGLLGHKDLNNIWTDFENPWFRQNVLSNLDPTILRQGLESLKPFVSALDSLIPLQQFDNDKDKETILEFAKKINKIHEVGSKVKNVTNSKTPFEEVSTCIEPLHPIQNPPNQAMLKRVENFSGKVVQRVEAFSKLMDDINKNGLKSIISFSKEIKKNIEVVLRAKNDSLNMEMFEKARKLEQEHNLADKLQWIADKLGEAPGDLFTEDRKIDYNVIQSVSTVFNGTNVESVLNCIKRSSVDNLIGMFEFVDQSDSLMNQKAEFATATNFISNMSKIQKNFQNVIGKVKSAKVSKDSKLLIDSRHFKDVGPHSRVIGGSLAALRAIESVLKAEKSIKSVIDMDAKAKSSIQKLLQSKSTDASINEMKQAETSVKEILKVLKTKNIDSISQIQSILNSLSQLKNQTDIKGDNIPDLANKLSDSKDPKLKSLATDLFTISRLDMRFNYHRKAFEVKNSLEATKQMLVDFLKTFIDDQDAERKRTTETLDSMDSSNVEEEPMNFWDWLNTDEAEELIWNISWYFTVGWVTFWVLFALSETICNIMFKRDFFFLKSPDHPDKQKERIGSAKQAEEKKAWMKNEEKKKNKKDKKESKEKKKREKQNPKKFKKGTK